MIDYNESQEPQLQQQDPNDLACLLKLIIEGIKNYNWQGWTNNLDKFLYLTETIEGPNEKIAVFFYEIGSLLLKYRSFHDSGQIEKAETCFHTALNLTNSKDVETISIYQAKLIRAYLDQNKSIEQSLKEFYAVAETIKNPNEKIAVLYEVGCTLLSYKKYPEAETCFQTLILTNSKDAETIIIYKAKLIQAQAGQNKSIEQELVEFFKLADKIKGPNNEVSCSLYDLGSQFFSRGFYKKAERCFRKRIELSSDKNNYKSYAAVARAISNQLDANSFIKASKVYFEAYKISLNLNDIDAILDLLDTLIGHVLRYCQEKRDIKVLIALFTEYDKEEKVEIDIEINNFYFACQNKIKSSDSTDVEIQFFKLTCDYLFDKAIQPDENETDVKLFKLWRAYFKNSDNVEKFTKLQELLKERLSVQSLVKITTSPLALAEVITMLKNEMNLMRDQIETLKEQDKTKTEQIEMLQEQIKMLQQQNTQPIINKNHPDDNFNNSIINAEIKRKNNSEEIGNNKKIKLEKFLSNDSDATSSFFNQNNKSLFENSDVISSSVNNNNNNPFESPNKLSSVKLL